MLQNNLHSDIYELISKKLADTLSLEETAQLNLLLKEEQNQQLFEQAQKIWNTTQAQKIDVDTEKALNKVNKRIYSKREEKSSKFNFSQWAGIAASILLIIGGLVVFYKINSPQLATITAINKEAHSKSLNLADGSLVELNQNSTLTYPKSFGDKTRDVRLEGEGYFSIKRNEQKPFIVHTKFTDIKVLGTSFYIKISKKKVEVTVESGKVMVINQQNKKQFVTLTKGQKSVFNNSSSTFKEDNIDPNDLFWKTRTLHFNQTNIKEVVAVLNKNYDQAFMIDSSFSDSILTLTRTFENQSVLQISNIISATLDISITQENDKIIFKSLKGH